MKQGPKGRRKATASFFEGARTCKHAHTLLKERNVEAHKHRQADRQTDKKTDRETRQEDINEARQRDRRET